MGGIWEQRGADRRVLAVAEEAGDERPPRAALPRPAPVSVPGARERRLHTVRFAPQGHERSTSGR